MYKSWKNIKKKQCELENLLDVDKYIFIYIYIYIHTYIHSYIICSCVSQGCHYLQLSNSTTLGVVFYSILRVGRFLSCVFGICMYICIYMCVCVYIYIYKTLLWRGDRQIPFPLFSRGKRDWRQVVWDGSLCCTMYNKIINILIHVRAYFFVCVCK